jgi:putative membrane protein
MRLLLHWLINAGALFVLPRIFSTIEVKSFYIALIVAAVLGLLNAVVRPILILLTLPVTLLTLGLFIFVINALLLWFVSSFVAGFHVDGFWAAMWGAIVYSLITFILNALVFGEPNRGRKQ